MPCFGFAVGFWAGKKQDMGFHKRFTNLIIFDPFQTYDLLAATDFTKPYQPIRPSPGAESAYAGRGSRISVQRSRVAFRRMQSDNLAKREDEGSSLYME